MRTVLKTLRQRHVVCMLYTLCTNDKNIMHKFSSTIPLQLCTLYKNSCTILDPPSSHVPCVNDTRNRTVKRHYKISATSHTDTRLSDPWNYFNCNTLTINTDLLCCQLEKWFQLEQVRNSSTFTGLLWWWPRTVTYFNMRTYIFTQGITADLA